MDSIFIKLQDVNALRVVQFKSDCGAALPEVRFELVANLRLDLFRLSRIAPANFSNVRGERNANSSRCRGTSLAAQHLLNSGRLNPPLRYEAIGGQPRM